MSTLEARPVAAVAPAAARPRGFWLELRRYVRRNPSLAIGLALLAALLGASGFASLVLDPELAEPLAGPVSRPPSLDHPFGTDSQGRDLLAVIAFGTWLTIKVGVIAGGLGKLRIEDEAREPRRPQQCCQQRQPDRE